MRSSTHYTTPPGTLRSCWGRFAQSLRARSGPGAAGIVRVVNEQPRDADADAVGPGAAEPEWWADPAMPWKHEPTRADIACLIAMGVLGVYSLAMIPLRPVLLVGAPWLLGSLGYGAGLAYIGALAAGGNPWWPLVLALGTVFAVALSSVYWWCGRLWGRRIVDVWSQNRSERTRRRWDRVWDFTHRNAVPAVLLSFLPLPLPMNVILVAVGASGVRFRTFLPVALAGALVVKSAWVALGYYVGEPAVQVVETYAWVLWGISIVLIAVMLVGYWWRQRGAARVDPGR